MQEQGIERIVLSRLASEGYIIRSHKGVYKDAAVPATRYDDIRSLWLSFDPRRRQFERIADLTEEYIVAGATAAYLRDIGDLDPEPYTFVCNVRKQSSRVGLRLVKASIAPDEMELVEGLPVAKVERIICDLVADGHDLSLVGDILADARRRRMTIDEVKLTDGLKPYARRYGLPRGHGDAFLDLFKR
jgi:hypothetical protein